MNTNSSTASPKRINLVLTIEEANLILESLGQLPFAQVHQLIGNIQQQAATQLQDSNDATK